VAAALVGCGASLKPGQYPAVDLKVAKFQVVVADARVTTALPDGPPDGVNEATIALPFPTAQFLSTAQDRLAQLHRNSGIELTVKVSVKRSQLTLIKDVQGNIIRWTVALGIVVQTPSGATLSRGTGSAWREISERGATAADMSGAYLGAAVGALDEYFGSEQTLKSMQLELDSFLRSHPQ